MDQVRPLPIKWPCDHATVDWSAYPLQTPSGGGRAPTPYRSKTPANGMTQKGIDLSRPVTEGMGSQWRSRARSDDSTARKPNHSCVQHKASPVRRNSSEAGLILACEYTGQNNK